MVGPIVTSEETVSAITLVDDLRSAWPPAERPLADGYQRPTLAGSQPLDALPLDTSRPSSVAVVVAEDLAGRLIAAPLIRTADGWARARPGDGASEALVTSLVDGASARGAFAWDRSAVAEPTSGERPIGVDQTNESVVVGDSLVVKWIASPGHGAERGVLVSAHLAEGGYREAPAPFGWLTWRRAGAGPVVVARADAFLPDAEDGWQWCIDRAFEHADHEGRTCAGGCGTDVGVALGRFAARLHLALARPTSRIAEPCDEVRRPVIAAWQAAAVAGLDDVIARTPTDAGEPMPGSLREPMLAALASLGSVDRTMTQPIHGDLHVGQILHLADAMAVIDFDGNPVVDGPAPDDRQPAARDVAQMTCSLEHIGRVVERQTDGRHAGGLGSWVATARTAFLASYRTDLEAAGRSELFDHRLLHAFEVEQECRELRYAARYLPDWRYAPLRTLAGWFRP